jgi:hypothetical protein
MAGMSRKKNLAMSPRDRRIALALVVGMLVVGGLLVSTGIFIPAGNPSRTPGAVPGINNPAALAQAPRLDGYPAPDRALGPEDLKPELLPALPEPARAALRWSLGWTGRRDGLQVRLLLFATPEAARQALAPATGDRPLAGLGESALQRGKDRVVFLRGNAVGVVSGPVGQPPEALEAAARELDAALVRNPPASR